MHSIETPHLLHSPRSAGSKTRTSDNIAKLPAFELAPGSIWNDCDSVAELALILLVVSKELLDFADTFDVHGVGCQPRDLHIDSLIHDSDDSSLELLRCLGWTPDYGCAAPL